MANSEIHWSLATFAQGGQSVAALEVNGTAYRLEPSLARVGLAGQDSVAGLFGDWPRANIPDFKKRIPAPNAAVFFRNVRRLIVDIAFLLMLDGLLVTR